jgi:hypothetical protein
MAYERCADFKLTDLEAVQRHVMERELARALSQPYGKQRRRQVSA